MQFFAPASGPSSTHNHRSKNDERHEAHSNPNGAGTQFPGDGGAHDPKEADRLADLGMRTGVEVRVLQAAPEAPLLVAVLDARIAVNYDVAKRIYVY